MEAIVRTGGKQYSVKEGDVITVEKLEGEVGSELELEDVLMVKPDGKDAEILIGAPTLADFRLKGEILEQGRGKKIIVFTYKRRKGFKKKRGHRQSYTRIRVLEILGPSDSSKSPVSEPAGESAAKEEDNEPKE